MYILKISLLLLLMPLGPVLANSGKATQSQKTVQKKGPEEKDIQCQFLMKIMDKLESQMASMTLFTKSAQDSANSPENVDPEKKLTNQGNKKAIFERTYKTTKEFCEGFEKNIQHADQFAASFAPGGRCEKELNAQTLARARNRKERWRREYGSRVDCSAAGLKRFEALAGGKGL